MTDYTQSINPPHKPSDWENVVYSLYNMGMINKLQTWWKLHKTGKLITAPELFVLVILMVFGSFLVFRIPLGAGFDEETHLLRVWEMANFNWIPNEKLATDLHFPSFYWDFSYRRQAILEPVDPGFWEIYASTPIDAFGFVDENLTTRSVYSPLLLLPQSLVMYFLGRMLHLPALTVLIAMRMAGLIIYTLMVWLAVRIAPFGKWTWAILVIAPMAIYQAGTISTDTISNGIGFLFVSSCLFIATRQNIRWKEWLLLLFLFFVLFSAKVNMTILAFLPFIIIPPSRFRMKAGYPLLVIFTLLLALIEVLGWNIIAYSRFFTALPGSNPITQVQYILTHPFSTIWLVISDLGLHLINYVQGWIADFGYGYWGSPWIIYPIYLLILIGSYYINDKAKPDKRTRLGLFLVFGISFIGTILSLYIFYNQVGSAQIQEVHGRYFTVIFPLLLLGLVGLHNLPIKIDQITLTRITIGLAIIGMAFYTTGMYLAFYVRCGTSFYKAGLCYQPVYKNWSPNSKYFQPLSSSMSLTQWFIPKCNGMSTLRVWIDSADADKNGTTEFIINDEDDDVIKLDQIETNANLPDQNWFTLSFPDDQKSGGKWYTLTIKNGSPEFEKGIRVASSLRAEYIDAPLLQNGTEIENDAIFQYGCIAGWQKLIKDTGSLITKR